MPQGGDVDFRPWLTPSGAYVLSLCASRWLAEASLSERVTSDRPSSASAALGVVMHKALELWVKASGWRQPLSFGPYMLEAERLLEQETGDSARARVKKRALARVVEQELAEWLRSFSGSSASAELSLSSPELRVRGSADLVVRTSTTLGVIDLKTGRPHPERERLQLVLYSALLGSSLDRVLCGVLRPLEGLCVQEVSAIECSETLFWLLRLRDQAIQDPSATPGAVCMGCPLRATCGAHWSAVDDGVITDVVRGITTRVETARHVMAVQVQSPDSQVALIHGLPLAQVHLGRSYAFTEVVATEQDVYRATSISRILAL